MADKSEWKTLPLPLRLKAGASAVTLRRWREGEFEAGESLSELAGSRAFLYLLDQPLAAVTVHLAGDGGVELAPEEGSWETGPGEMEPLCRSLPVTLAVRIGRGWIAPDQLVRLVPDSLWPLDLGDRGWTARLYLPELGLNMAWGEVLALGDSMGFRITDMEIRAGVEEEPPGGQTLGYSCEMGRTTVSLEQLLDLAEGSVLSLSGGVGEPAALVLDTGRRYPAYPREWSSGPVLWLPPRDRSSRDGLGGLSEGGCTAPLSRRKGSWEAWAAAAERADDQRLRKLLKSETPAACAPVLAALEPSRSGQLLESLEEPRREVLFSALAGFRPDRVPAGVWQLLTDELGELLDLPGEGKPAGGYPGGAAAGVLDALPAVLGRQLLDKLAEEAPAEAEGLKTSLYRFEDLSGISDADFQVILGELEEDLVVRAMAGGPRAFVKKVYANVPDEVAATLKEDSSYGGEIPADEAETARQTVLETFKRLRREGVLPVE